MFAIKVKHYNNKYIWQAGEFGIIFFNKPILFTKTEADEILETLSTIPDYNIDDSLEVEVLIFKQVEESA